MHLYIHAAVWDTIRYNKLEYVEKQMYYLTNERLIGILGGHINDEYLQFNQIVVTIVHE